MDTTETSNPPHIEELHLKAFKSFRQQVLPLSDLTVLVGRNSSGKSNALDALVFLSRLAGGQDVREALDGSRTGQEPIRGGSVGCPPFGETSFQVGCRVHSDDWTVDYDVLVDVQPNVRIMSEQVVCVSGTDPEGNDLSGRVLLESRQGLPSANDLGMYFYNGDQSLAGPILTPRHRSILIQAFARLPADSHHVRHLMQGVAGIADALKNVFVLDPVPHLMRQYVNINDASFRSNADNLSATLAVLRSEDPEGFSQLERMVSDMSEQHVDSLSTVETDLGDVQVVLCEKSPNGTVNRVPARSISDGVLRFLAFGAAVLSSPLLVSAGYEVFSDRQLVVEEVENGLHPDQASRVLALLKQQAHNRPLRVLLTTHSPALLNALDGEDHEGMVVCDRDPESGNSRLRRLIELPGYPELMASGGLGDAVAEGRLPAAGEERGPGSGAFDTFLRSL